MTETMRRCPDAAPPSLPVATRAGVASLDRFSLRNPCPVCGGGHDLPQGRGVRCTGFRSDDGRWAYCSREEYAGPLPRNDRALGTYRHLLDGDCRCGAVHGTAPLPVHPIAIATPRPPNPAPEPDWKLAHRAYSALLDLCPVTDAHRRHLRDERGLTDAEVDGGVCGYRFGSLPAGQDALARLAQAVAHRIGVEPDELVGAVPGWIHRHGRVTLHNNGRGGLLIGTPALDGRINALRIRQDDGGYRALSGGQEFGGISTPGHTVSVAMPNDAPRALRFAVCAEGEFKAIAVCRQFRIPVVCFPGINATAHVAGTVVALGVEHVVMAVDADAETNEDVRRGKAALGRSLAAAGLRVGDWQWTLDEGKGIDDLLATGGLPFPVPWMDEAPPLPNPAAVEEANARARRAEQRNGALLRAISAPNLGPEKVTYVAIANAVGAAGGELIPLTKKELAAEIGAGENTVKNHLKAIRDGAWPLAGLVEVVEARVPERVNRTTGEVYGGYTCLHFRRADGVTDLDLLDAIAVAPPPPKGPKNGVGRYLRCPDCGHDQFVKTVTYTCACCDKVMRQETSTVRLPDVHANDEAADDGSAADAGSPGVGSNIDPYVTDSEGGWVSEGVETDPPVGPLGVGSMFDPTPGDEIDATDPFTDPHLVIRPVDLDARRRAAEDRRFHEAHRLLGTLDARRVGVYARDGHLWVTNQERIGHALRGGMGDVLAELLALVEATGAPPPPGAVPF